MEFKLKNGEKVNIRKVAIDDAADIINIISTADTESKFLSRNPGEFSITEAQEKDFISNMLKNDNEVWFVAEYKGKVVGQSSIGLIRNTERCKHRAEAALVILKKYWGIGIGKTLMHQCLNWCKDKNITQIELSVVTDNKRAITMYESFGFKTTGTIPNAMRYFDGSYADEKIMVLEL